MVTKATSSCPEGEGTGWALACAYTSVACNPRRMGSCFYQALGPRRPSSLTMPVPCAHPRCPSYLSPHPAGRSFLFLLTSPSAVWGLVPSLSAASPPHPPAPAT